MAYVPDGAVPVFAYEKTAVFGHGNSHRATPDFALRRDEAGHKILVFTTRFTGGMIERYAYDLITSPFHPVPRTVEGGENVAFVFSRKLVAGVETQIKRGRVCLYKHVGNNHLISKLRMFSLVSRIRMIADVKPRPAIKAARTHAADVVGRQIFADLVSFVGAHPELVRAGPECNSDCIANSPCINLLSGTIGIKFENTRPIFFRGLIGHIRARTDR